MYQSNKSFRFLSFMWIWVWIPVRLGGFYNENKRSPNISSSSHPVFEIWCKMKMQSSNRKIIKLLQIFIFMWFFTQKQNFISIIPFYLEGEKDSISVRRERFGGEKKCLSEIIFSNQWFRILSPKPHLTWMKMTAMGKSFWELNGDYH